MFNGKISVIISTYNREKALEKVLVSLINQTDDNYELIVADDGSNYKTQDVVNKIRKQSNVCLKYAWQEDEGFRLARIRNKAIMQATGEYIILIDGDCIAPKNFIRNHRKLAEKGWAIMGQRILSNKTYSKYLEDSSNYKVPIQLKPKTLFKLFLKRKVNRFLPAVEINCLPLRTLRKLKPKNWKLVKGCNFSFWKNDYEKINGSDENFLGWGSEDKDLAVRLVNSGVFLKDGRNYVWVLHLWHQERSRTREHTNFRMVVERAKSKQILPIKGMFDE